MKLPKNKILIAISAFSFAILLLFGFYASADDATQTLLNPWTIVSGFIKARSATNGVQVPSLSSTGNPCLSVDSVGKFATTTCGSGGGGGGSTTTIISNVTTNGPAFTFATTTQTGIGLNITGSGSTITFQPTISTSTLGLMPLSTGTTGFGARWSSNSQLSTGIILDNNTVSGVNATSATASFNVQGSGSLSAFNVSSSTGTSEMTVLNNGYVGIGTNSPASPLTVIPLLNAANTPAVAFQSGAGSGTIKMGADVNATTLTSGARKLARIVMPAWDAGATNVLLFSGDIPATGLSNDVYFGGTPGGSQQGATSIHFDTNAATTTTGGTDRMVIASNGSTTLSSLGTGPIYGSTGSLFTNGTTGTGLTVQQTSPTLITPILGVASATALTVSGQSFLATTSISGTLSVIGLPTFSGVSNCSGTSFLQISSGLFDCAVPSGGGGGGSGGGWSTSTDSTGLFIYNSTGGFVGINSTSPTAALVVQGNSGSTTPELIVASSTGASQLVVTSAGNVGIGTSTPTALLTTQGTSGNLIQAYNGATSEFSVTSAGAGTFLGLVSAGSFKANGSAVYGGATFVAGSQSPYWFEGNYTGTTAGLGFRFDNQANSRSVTTGYDFIQVGQAGDGFSPSSGSGVMNLLLANNGFTINQTGSANGIVRSMYINPILTSTYDYRNFEIPAAQNTISNAANPTQNLYNVLLNPMTYGTASTSVYTIASASTFSILGAPIASTTRNTKLTNSYGAFIMGGALNASTTNGYGLYASAPSGATNNFAAGFNGTVNLSGITSSFLAADATGNIIATTTPAGGGSFTPTEGQDVYFTATSTSAATINVIPYATYTVNQGKRVTGTNFHTPQAALDACGTNGGANIYLTDPAYAQGSTGLLFKGSNCNIYGTSASTTISFTGAISYFKTNSAAAKYSYNGVHNLTITGDGNTASVIFNWSDMTHFIFDHIVSDNAGTLVQQDDTQNTTFYNLGEKFTATTLTKFGWNASSTNPANANTLRDGFIGCTTNCTGWLGNNGNNNLADNVFFEPGTTTGTVGIDWKDANFATNDGWFDNTCKNCYVEANGINLRIAASVNAGGGGVQRNKIDGGIYDAPGTTNISATNAVLALQTFVNVDNNFGNVINSFQAPFGVGTTTPIASAAIVGVGAANPFAVASSTGTVVLTVAGNLTVGINTTTPTADLTLQGTSGHTNLAFMIASSSGAVILTVDYARPAPADFLLTVASSTLQTLNLFTVDGLGNASTSGYSAGLYFRGNGGAVTIATSTGVGAGAGTTVSLSNASQSNGKVDFKTTNAPVLNATIVTITFPTAFANAPNCILQSATTSPSFIQNIWATSTTTTLLVKSSTTALTATSSYAFYYWCPSN